MPVEILKFLMVCKYQILFEAWKELTLRCSVFRLLRVGVILFSRCLDLIRAV
jgi:hypothetical protein